MKNDKININPNYETDQVAAIAKSPTSLFVYWELSGERSEIFRQSHEEVEWYLCLKNIDKSGAVTWQTLISIEPEAGNHYLQVQPGNRYRVELGVRVGNAPFHPICHTREHMTPRDTPPPGEQGMPREKQDVRSEKENILNSSEVEELPEGLRWRPDWRGGPSS